ncbi:MAG: hypothetical protein ACYTFM_04040 [Planctomycetota bacterium]|jgi:TolA-binding protein
MKLVPYLLMADDKKQNESTQIVVSKSFMAVGPTLHYSHKNVQRCWLLGFIIFCLCCLFWSKIVTGDFISFNLHDIISPQAWGLGRVVVSGISIFEHPWQIEVLGLLMGIISVMPMLVSQLMSFRHSVLFVLAVLFMANLPVFAVCILISCFAVACRPLRFRSRFTSIALCMAPQLIYWASLGSVKGTEPIQWGFTFVPWINAWLVGLLIAAIVLIIGHFTRYRPGLIGAVCAVVLFIAIILFETLIGFDELDYQLYVAENDPEQVTEFHPHSLTQALDINAHDPKVKDILLEGYFSTKDQIALRTKLKERIQNDLLRYKRWPYWFIKPEEFNYQQKARQLHEQFDRFIRLRSDSNRMPIALYYKGLLSEYNPDIQRLGKTEELQFYNDYPFEHAFETWYLLYKEFPNSPESLEARWRVAMYWAGQGRFTKADKALQEAQEKIAEQMKNLDQQQEPVDTLFSPFQPPPKTVMTKSKLDDLKRRVDRLRVLISEENQIGDKSTKFRLEQFVSLNPYEFEYGANLQTMLDQTPENDGLRDNILLARAKLIKDEQLQIETFTEIHNEFIGRDGGVEALYELSLLRSRIWSQLDQSNLDLKKKALIETRAAFEKFIQLYPNSIFAEQAKTNLENLPTVE